MEKYKEKLFNEIEGLIEKHLVELPDDGSPADIEQFSQDFIKLRKKHEGVFIDKKGNHCCKSKQCKDIPPEICACGRCEAQKLMSRIERDIKKIRELLYD